MEKLVEVYRAHGELEALVVQGLLENSGIDSILKSDAALSVHVLMVDGMAEVSVLVRESEASQARELIDQDKHNAQ